MSFCSHSFTIKPSLQTCTQKQDWHITVQLRKASFQKQTDFWSSSSFSTNPWTSLSQLEAQISHTATCRHVLICSGVHQDRCLPSRTASSNSCSWGKHQQRCNLRPRWICWIRTWCAGLADYSHDWIFINILDYFRESHVWKLSFSHCEYCTDLHHLSLDDPTTSAFRTLFNPPIN